MDFCLRFLCVQTIDYRDKVGAAKPDKTGQNLKSLKSKKNLV